MDIQYDKLTQAYSQLRALRQAFLDGLITNAELKDQEKVIKDNIREILGFPPIA